jgi:hypothetical protein
MKPTAVSPLNDQEHDRAAAAGRHSDIHVWKESLLAVQITIRANLEILHGMLKQAEMEAETEINSQ